MPLKNLWAMPKNLARDNSCLTATILLLFFSLFALSIILLEERRNWWRDEAEERQTDRDRGKEEKRRREEERKWRESEGKWTEEEGKRMEDGEGKRRLKRQSLPTDNVMVFASNSNVSVTDRVQVLSKESQIRILERNLNTTVWSNASFLEANRKKNIMALCQTICDQMSQSGDQISLSASQAIALIMKMGERAKMEGTGDTLQLNDSSNVPSSLSPQSSASDFVRSRMEVQLTGQRVNLSLADLATHAIAFSATDARVASVVATDWSREKAQEEVRILSTPTEEGEQRELSVVANSPEYQVQIRLIGAKSALLFRDAHLQIPSDHRSLLLNALDWRVSVRSALSPFELQATDNRLQLNCFEEALSLVLLPDTIQLNVGQLSSLVIIRSSFLPGKMRVSGAIVNNTSGVNSLLLTDRMEMVSRSLSLLLSRNGSDQKSNISDQSVLIDAVNSHLRLFHSNHTIASLNAAKHFVEILGGRPFLQISAGNISVEMELRKEVETVAELNTDILPKELIRTENVGDSFGGGPFVIGPNGTTITQPIVHNGTHLSTPPRLGPSPSAASSPLLSSTIASALNLSFSPPPASSPFPATPQMADPSELFTFRHTFPPSFVSPSLAVPSSSSSTTENELLAQLNDSAPAFPSPDSDLFTFAPSLPPDADFLVGQFDTFPSPRITQGLFPLSATISALQFPEDAEDEQQQKQNIAQQFPGIRRENLLIWRPEQMGGTEESEGGGKLETYLVDEQGEEGEEGKRPRRTLNEDGRTTEEQPLMRAEMEVDIALEGEEDLRAERLRIELGEGIERMLEEYTTDKRVRETEREQRKQQQGTIKEEEEKEEMEREERQRKETTRKRDGREGKGRKTKAEGDNQRGREQDRGRNAREEDDKEDEEIKGGRKASQLRVTDLHLEYLGRMDTTKKEVVRMHFTLEGDRKELEEGVRRIGQMDKTKEEKALMHEFLSKPRLTNGTYAGIPFSPSPSSSASSTLSAISAHSLPALFIGSLCLSAALLIMLIVLRPSARAFSRIKQWKKRIEWKVKRNEGKMGGGGRKREGNGTGILPM